MPICITDNITTKKTKTQNQTCVHSFIFPKILKRHSLMAMKTSRNKPHFVIHERDPFTVTDTTVSFVIRGRPIALQQHRTGRNGVIYNPTQKLGEAFVAAYRSACWNRYKKLLDILFPHGVGVIVSLIFGFPPEGEKKKQPILENLVKFVLDAMNRVLYDDDRQVLHIIAEKRYNAFYGTEGYTLVEAKVIPYQKPTTDNLRMERKGKRFSFAGDDPFNISASMITFVVRGRPVPLQRYRIGKCGKKFAPSKALINEFVTVVKELFLQHTVDHNRLSSFNKEMECLTASFCFGIPPSRRESNPLLSCGDVDNMLKFATSAMRQVMHRVGKCISKVEAEKKVDPLYGEHGYTLVIIKVKESACQRKTTTSVTSDDTTDEEAEALLSFDPFCRIAKSTKLSKNAR